MPVETLKNSSAEQTSSGLIINSRNVRLRVMEHLNFEGIKLDQEGIIQIGTTSIETKVYEDSKGLKTIDNVAKINNVMATRELKMDGSGKLIRSRYGLAKKWPDGHQFIHVVDVTEYHENQKNPEGVIIATSEEGSRYAWQFPIDRLQTIASELKLKN